MFPCHNSSRFSFCFWRFTSCSHWSDRTKVKRSYEVEIFRVPRHSGVCPLCLLSDQGRYFSWNNESGPFTDGENKRHCYCSISSTSCGRPDGLFVIIAVITRSRLFLGDQFLTICRKNSKIYPKSQEQRALARNIRCAKQKAVMLEKLTIKKGLKWKR